MKYIGTTFKKNQIKQIAQWDVYVNLTKITNKNK